MIRILTILFFLGTFNAFADSLEETGQSAREYRYGITGWISKDKSTLTSGEKYSIPGHLRSKFSKGDCGYTLDVAIHVSVVEQVANVRKINCN